MGDWIGLGLFVLVIVGALVGLSQLGKKPKRLTEEEYEQRVAEAKGTTRAAALAGMNALNKMINPKAVEAIEVQRDLKAGFYNDEEKKGEGDGPDAGSKRLGPTGEGGGDA
ncbi:MAG: hypothetical protein JOZ96_15855 [Acidobacteria bacterium]|nr:hypothetical protein [Acidobacteriota bacterium]